jgi:FAD/FMN-containing dehydrogenase
MLSRRLLLQQGAGAGLLASTGLVGARPSTWQSGEIVNDIHAQLNRTRVAEVRKPRSVEELQALVRLACERRLTVSVCGGRHAMGGQQFASQSLLIDMSAMNRVVAFDRSRGVIEVLAGMQWPELVQYLVEQQVDSTAWGIRQKQTGADRLSIGGSLSVNGHGRGLAMQPLVGDVESFVLVDAEGKTHRCSRQENQALFRLAIGGYGLFGVVASVSLRLTPRIKLERVVEIGEVDGLMGAMAGRIAEGYVYGDFQYATDERSLDYLRRGVFSCYRPVADETPMRDEQRELSPEQWKELLYLAHVNKRRAYELYSQHYLATNGQVYWSDTHQLTTYLDDYHRELDARLGSSCKATEVISEIYVPRDALTAYLDEVRRDFRAQGVNLIYGTIRLIEEDRESFLAWAKQPYACIVFNLHTLHTPEGFHHSKRAFRRLIDRAIPYGGSFFLTYHRWATRQQIECCYPQFEEFLRRKRELDPERRFQSDWYRHYSQSV